VDVDRSAVPTVSLGVRHVGPAHCPTCGRVCSVYDHSEERSWRHLDTMRYATVVVARIPRTDCPEHGVVQVSVPWAGAKSRFTIEFEEFAIYVLGCTKSQVRTARILGLTPHQVHDVMHRAVNRGLARRTVGTVHHVGIDEKSFQGRDFATVVCDLVGKRVLEVVGGRKAESALKAFEALPSPESVKTICMDMSEAYKKAALDGLPNAEHIHDRFHVAALLGEAVDETRRSESKKSPELKESRYVWLKNPENLTAKQKTRFDELVGTELRTAEAYALKQVFRSFFDQGNVESAHAFFQDWYGEVQKRSLPRMKHVAKTLSKNLEGLLSAVKWKLTNAYAESINSSIQELKTVARGFRKFENFRIAILFFLGKLDLNPHKRP
jgi:transposase